MFQRLTIVALCCTAGSVAAEDCPGFGFGNAYLDTHFCGQFADIIGPVTRSITNDEPGSPPADMPAEWWGLPMVQDAHRVDPAKTLQLIQRIRDAGGEPPS